MEYMRTLLRDNELFRTYVTVSPGGDPLLIYGFGSVVWGHWTVDVHFGKLRPG